jgi:hypothetical protein
VTPSSPTALERMRCRFSEIEIPRSLPRGPSSNSGVYLLVNRGEIIYVGASKFLESRIYGHRSEPQWQISSLPPKRFDRAFVYRLPVAVMHHYEGAFIRALSPKFNCTAPPRTPGYDNEILEGFDLTPHADEDAAHEAWRMVRQLRHLEIKAQRHVVGERARSEQSRSRIARKRNRRRTAAVHTAVPQ